MQEAVVLAAVVPSFFVVWFLQSRRGRGRRGRTVWLAFLSGMLPGLLLILLAATPATGLAEPLSTLPGSIESPHARALFRAFVLAALPEELLKLAVVLLVVRFAGVRDARDGMLLGVAASLGFAGLENVLFAEHSGWATAALRSLTAVPCHGFLGALMGRFVAEGALRRGLRAHKLGLAFCVPAALHGLYDYPLFLAADWTASSVPVVQRVATMAVFAGVLAGGTSWALALARDAEDMPGEAPLGARVIAWLELQVGGALVALATWLIVDLAVSVARAEVRIETAQAAVLLLLLAESLCLAFGLGLFARGVRHRRVEGYASAGAR